MWSVSESSAQSKTKMDCKVTFGSTSKRSQVRNVKNTVCVSWHLLLCQGPLLWSLFSSFEGARDGSLLLQSLSFISTPSHHTLGGGWEGAAQADTTGFLYLRLLPCSFPPSYSPFPLHASGPLLVLFDLKTFCILPRFSVHSAPTTAHTHRHTLSV